MKLAVGLVLAIGAAAAFAISYAGQYQALNDSDRLSLRRLRHSIGLLLRNRRWLLSWCASIGGWGLYIGALALAPLSLVQSVNAAVLGPLALISHRTSRALARRERWGTFLAGAGVILVLATVPAAEHPRHASLTAVLVIVAIAFGLFALLGVAAPARGRGVVLGIGSGLCYAAGDIATKSAVSGEAVLIPVFLLCVTLGFVTLQLSYQRTTLLDSAGLSALFTNALPIAAGVVLFGESPAALALALRSLGFAVVVVGAVLLASEGGEQPVEVPAIAEVGEGPA